MKISITGIIVAFAAILSLTGCSEDIVNGNEVVRGGKEIRLTAEYALFDNGASGPTRAVSIPEKTSFQTGDAIHVSAVFTLAEGQGTKTMYNCFVYKGNQWVSTVTPDASSTEEVMTWPWNAVSGSFTAYYMPKSSDGLQTGKPYSCTLNGTSTDCDILYAEAKDLAYGHAVNLSFSHLCTRLVLTEVKNGYVDKFGLRIGNETGGYKQSNIWRLTRNADNTLKADFTQQADSVGNTSVISTVGTDRVLVFYLQPGDYSKSEICYNSVRPYLTLDVDALNNCQAGHSYELNVKQTPGIIEEEDDDPWTDAEKEEPHYVLDVEKFLESITQGKPYEEKDPETGETVQITKIDADGHIELQKNLDFHNVVFTPKKLSNSGYLHGAYHYIKNIANTLFEEINGTVDNLELRDVHIDLPDGDKNGILLRVGALTRRLNGNVRNIRLNNCYVHAYSRESSVDVRSIGSLVGEQFKGVIEQITLMGKIQVLVSNEEGRPICNNTIDLGGIVGQSAGIVRGVRMAEGMELKVINNAFGTGIISTGGLMGICAGTISDCILKADVDVTSSRALQNCVGGLIGRMRSGSMVNCSVEGSVSGGTAIPSDDNLGYALSGGICGYFVDNPLINSCNAFCTVSEEMTHTDVTDRIYSTGGAFGRITPNGYDINNNLKNCNVIVTVNGKAGNNAVGSFVGQTVNVDENILTANANRASDTNNHNFCGEALTQVRRDYGARHALR